MTKPEIVTTIADLRARVAMWRKDGARVGMVPTMGALHDGHLSLVRTTGSVCQKVVVSIFVNPTQFGPHEDFDRYPRDVEADADKLATTGKADLIFVPAVREMYPDGFATKLEVGGPSDGLETDYRPHFFSGVATVVSKLLIAAMPDYAIFGEKDYQQLMVIRRMGKDLALPVEMAGGAILREADGLGMSARNAYRSAEDRKIAGRLNLVLKDTVMRLKHGDPAGIAEDYARAAILEAGFDTVDYAAVRDAATLGPAGAGPLRVLAAAKIGSTRLIDNMAV